MTSKIIETTKSSLNIVAQEINVILPTKTEIRAHTLITTIPSTLATTSQIFNISMSVDTGVTSTIPTWNLESDAPSETSDRLWSIREIN